MHVFDDHMMDIQGHKVRSINLGSWFEEKVRVFCLNNGQGEWVTLPELMRPSADKRPDKSLVPSHPEVALQ